ncbi:MAG: hypothetical protein HY851_09930 [candidate division Zixibacteria bacterium]|nr:hypothetical protein [candidate division Zixibacteria bacterium]
MSLAKRIALLFILLVLPIICWIRCDKGVVDSHGGDTLQSYTAYFYDNRGAAEKPYFRYRYPADSLDSFALPIAAGELDVSIDGGKLYVRNRTGGFVKIYSTKTLNEVGQLPWGRIALSPDNRLVAISGEDLWIYRTSDYSAVFHDTDAVGGGRFTRDGRRYWDKGGDYLYRVDLTSRYKVRRYPVTRSPIGENQVAFTADERSFFFLNGVADYVDIFRHYDLSADSVLFSDLVVPGQGDLVVSPDGQRVYYSSPGSLISYPRSYSYCVYTAEARDRDSVVLGYDCWGSVYLFDPYQLSVTSDGRFLFGLSLWGGTAELIDAETNVPEKTICVGLPTGLRYPTVCTGQFAGGRIIW